MADIGTATDEPPAAQKDTLRTTIDGLDRVRSSGDKQDPDDLNAKSELDNYQKDLDHRELVKNVSLFSILKYVKGSTEYTCFVTDITFPVGSADDEGVQGDLLIQVTKVEKSATSGGWQKAKGRRTLPHALVHYTIVDNPDSALSELIEKEKENAEKEAAKQARMLEQADQNELDETIDGGATDVSFDSYVDETTKPCTLKIVQWNQKWLTTTRTSSASCVTSWEMQRKSIGETIRKEPKLTVCVMEEIKSKEAVKSVTEWLNNKDGVNVWGYVVSKAVNVKNDEGESRVGGNKEMFAAIFRKEVTGDPDVPKILLNYPRKDEGFGKAPPGTNLRSDAASRTPDAPDDVVIGETKIDMSDAFKVYKAYEAYDEDMAMTTRLDHFQYSPVVFSFPKCVAGPLHIMAVHGSTGRSGRKVLCNQNALEVAYIQHICSKAVDGGEFIVLAGDFNTQEEANKNERLWDTRDKAEELKDDEPIFMAREELRRAQHELDLDEQNVLGCIRDSFLERFSRAIRPSLPTNVYPFLTGIQAVPKHNDDIFVPKAWTGKLYKGKVFPIPTTVIRRWDIVCQNFFDNNPSLVKMSNPERQALNSALARVWSDHRPVQAKFTVETPKAKAEKAAAAADAIQEDIIADSAKMMVMAEKEAVAVAKQEKAQKKAEKVAADAKTKAEKAMLKAEKDAKKAAATKPKAEKVEKADVEKTDTETDSSLTSTPAPQTATSSTKKAVAQPPPKAKSRLIELNVAGSVSEETLSLANLSCEDSDA
ncbi:hypothetical protein TrRE_jg13325 [Triparma retinervis]|uniref:Endonuclease/exonuclease/phosphatase domain-containing protein n=1 Tax=Triparma retinervis TaxID=2557542 RepID=A0A9W6ZJD3_9STRA|nr:hypothetical protein TrRE_jg13325 [Triparma retinervis]